MRRFYYDLHVHSALSPCADDDTTPADIAGIASLIGLDIVALTDHNSCKNCPAFFAAAERYGITAVAGMELTTSEDIHAVCLFDTLDGALRFDAYLDEFRTPIKNKPEIFGRQLIFNEADEIAGEVTNLLSFSVGISLEQLPELVEKFGGVCFPAHVDREANGVISVLGTFPSTPHFDVFELRDASRAAEYAERYLLSDKLMLTSSDAHRLTDISERENFIELDCESNDHAIIRQALFARLGRKK